MRELRKAFQKQEEEYKLNRQGKKIVGESGREEPMSERRERIKGKRGGGGNGVKARPLYATLSGLETVLWLAFLLVQSVHPLSQLSGCLDKNC